MATTSSSSASQIAGFGPVDLGSILLGGKVLDTSYQEAIIDMFIQRTLTGISIVTMQLADPYRKLLQTIVRANEKIVIDGLEYTLVQTMKASDQLQLVFESSLVHKLRLLSGQTKSTVGYNITQFISGLVQEAGGVLKGPDYEKIWPFITKQPIYKLALARGTTADKNENSWTCMSRLASSVGWRLWESAGVIYFGPDEYWLGNVTLPSGKAGSPPINAALGTTGKNLPILKEFTQQVQLIDFDWDIGKPYGQATVTCMLDNFNFNIGEIVQLQNMGPANGYWMVAGTQRDLFMPQATVTLQIPMPIDSYIVPTSLPVNGAPLTPITKAIIK